jgi:hypothetical protein
MVIALAWGGLHVPYLHLPPLGHNSWRPADVLGVGRNYCEEQASFWLPRVDSRGDTTGITGMEFPLLNWLEGQAACAGLNQVVFARALTILFAMLAIVCAGLIATPLPGVHTPTLATFVFATSPIFWFFGASPQPDVPALAMLMLSLALLRRSLGKELNATWLLLSAAAASLGVLFKLPVILLGAAGVAMLLTQQGFKALRLARVWLAAVVALLPPVLWYRYARQLQEQYGLQTFFLGDSPRMMLTEVLQPSLYESVFLQKWFDCYAFPVFSAIAVLGLIVDWRSCEVWLKTLAAASVAYVLLAGDHATVHFYYGLPLIPFIALSSARAMAVRIDGQRSRFWRPAALVLSGVALLYGPHRVAHWWPSADADTPYREAASVIDRGTSAADKIIVFSRGDPTLFWMLHRRGWLAPDANTEEWLRKNAATAHVLVCDRRKSDLDALREQLTPVFNAAGFKRVWGAEPLDVWVR